MHSALRPKNTIRLGTLLGIPVELEFSLFFTLGLLMMALSSQYFPLVYRSGSPAVHWIMGASASLLLAASILRHELARCFP